MADDWKPGDLALCVRGGYLIAAAPGIETPKAGRIYTVEQAAVQDFYPIGDALGLWLRDGPSNRGGESVWLAARFRKIHPHQRDAEDDETIKLLRGEPVDA